MSCAVCGQSSPGYVTQTQHLLALVVIRNYEFENQQTQLPVCHCRERTVSKEYLAIVVGVPHPPARQQQQQQQAAADLQQAAGRLVFSVNAPIDQHPLYDTARRIVPDGKPAVTHVEVRLAGKGGEGEGRNAKGASQLA